MNSSATPWNKDRIIGQKTAFTPAEIAKIIRHLKSEKSRHELCLFTLGIDTMLRCSDLLQLRVSDVLTHKGTVRKKFPTRQTKTKNAVFPVLTKATQEACERWIDISGKTGSDFLFTGKKTDTSTPVTDCVYRAYVKKWADFVGVDPSDYSTHSLRRSKPIYMYRQGVKIEYLTILLGHKTPQSTMEYLGLTLEKAQNLALEHDIFASTSTTKNRKHASLKNRRNFTNADLDYLAKKLFVHLTKNFEKK